MTRRSWLRRHLAGADGGGSAGGRDTRHPSAKGAAGIFRSRPWELPPGDSATFRSHRDVVITSRMYSYVEEENESRCAKTDD